MKKIIKILGATAALSGGFLPNAFAWEDSKWLWTANNTADNQWAAFRKQINLDQKPDSAIIKVAVDSKYWLWVNGQLVVFEGALKRGPTPQDTWYDEVDISQYLQQGENTLAILGWYWGKQGFSHKDSGRAGMIAHLTADGQQLASDSSWKVKSYSAYKNSNSGSQPNYRLPEYNVVFDSRESLGNWYSAAYNDQNWASASTYGAEGSAPWNELVKRDIPQWKDSGLVAYENTPSLPFTSNGQPITVNLPYNAQVTPYFKVNSSQSGQTVHIKTDGYNDGGPVNVRAEYVTKAGEQSYESYGWMSGHSMTYTFPAGVEVLELKYRETGYNTEFVGQWSTNDVFYNKLWDKAGRTLYINMRDTFFDCPTRERAQWWGDVVNQLGEVFYVFDSDAHKLIKKGITDLSNFQRSNGTLYSPVPDGNWNRELASQMLASVGEYGFWTYYFNTGDIDTIRQVYPNVRRYLEVYTMRGDGLINYRSGDWNWGDWGSEQDRYVIQTTMYYMALNAARKMAAELGETQDFSWYDTRINSIKANFDRVLWKNNHYRSGDVATADDRANALAVVSGLASPDKYQGITNVLRSTYRSSPYMEKYVLEALYQMGEEDFALTRMKSRYAQMVADDYTTLWELWSKGGGSTNNHAWNAPNTILAQYTSGVAPTSVGWSTYSVLPQMGKLTSIQQRVPSIKGNIDLTLNKEDWGVGITLDSPVNTVAKVGIPLNYFTQLNSVEINGTTVYSDGSASGSLGGVEFAGQNSQFVMFNLQPGSWTIEGRGEVVPVHVPDWTHCANENETCSFDGKTNVRYGAGSQYTELEATNQVQCDNDTFGDPASGLVKNCEYDAAALVPVTTWTHCADENGTCTFTGTRKVRYGANGLFAQQTATGSIACNNSVFGDPISGVVKSCEVEELPQTQWTQCATEGQTCNVPALSEVRYGANETYSAVQQVSSSVSCSNTVFGDPIYGVAKSCEYRLLP
ncbi:alpha-L-rhamnosidase N-terminal domain-containing protein [Endozoicomonas sp. OPT23]|uniref:alpha-L-rhamnosidase-related protein n=1 Tax=Endozoicomonas sp. OPT23 TaxID=2072845 RepID=UPI001891DC8A|nr:alpha-L-rhamnosidase N-terminal domain-containing protein [Endozoicomonas sp. OPT23]